MVEIIGIACDGKGQETVDTPAPCVYLPFPQPFRSNMTPFLHTAGDRLSLAPMLPRDFQSRASDIPVYGIHSMRETFDAHGLLASRLMAQMAGAAGMIGLLLGAAGLLAVIAFWWRADPGDWNPHGARDERLAAEEGSRFWSEARNPRRGFRVAAAFGFPIAVANLSTR